MPRRSTALTLVACSVPMFMATLDNLVLSTALPSLARSLDAGLDSLAWIVNAYTLTFAALLIGAATLGDRIGRRRTFVAGIVVFGLASVASALSTTATQLIAARAVQGAGAAAVMPLSLTLLAGAVPTARRAAAIGIWGAVSGCGIALGPVIGGAVVDGLSWQAIFWVNVPVAATGVVLATVGLDETRGRRRRPDVAGLLLAGTGVLALTWGVLHGNDDGWTSRRVLGTLVGGVGLLAGFVLRQSRAADPLVPLTMFRTRSFAVANGAGLLFSAGAFGIVFLLAQYLQVGMGYSAFAAGARTLPWTAAPMVVAPVAGWLAPRVGVRSLLVWGLAAEAAGIAWIGALVRDGVTGYGRIVPALVLAGVGMGLTFAPSATAVLADLPGDDHATASSVNSTIREIGTALGVAIAVAVFQAADGVLSPTGFAPGLWPAAFVAAALVAAGGLVAVAMPAVTGRLAGTGTQASSPDAAEPHDCAEPRESAEPRDCAGPPTRRPAVAGAERQPRA